MFIECQVLAFNKHGARYCACSFTYGGSFAWGWREDIKTLRQEMYIDFFRFSIMKLESKCN